MSGRDLQECFHFTEEDLNANRTGQLSQVQMKRFAESGVGCFRIALGLTILFAVAAVATYFFASVAVKSWAIWMLLGLTLVCLSGTVMAWHSRDDKNYLFQIEGIAELRIDHADSGSRRYTLTVKGYDFTLDPNQYETLASGDNYRIYYATMESDPDKQKTTSKLIQSLERI